jgi:membrane-associated protein
VSDLIDLVGILLHLDIYLGSLIEQYGLWIYLILFIILFLETGLVITPFLPGDSLIFAAGAFAALGVIDPVALLAVMAAGAIIGDTVNYWIGKKIGQRAAAGKIRFVRKEHIDRTGNFYKKHGGKTIIIARFVPLIRTFAPFVAGLGKMAYGRFLTFNVTGGIAWVAIFLGLGYFFGNMPFVRDNFSLVIVAIIVISLVPAAVAFVKQRK